jgi:hypothetical protein
VTAAGGHHSKDRLMAQGTVKWFNPDKGEIEIGRGYKRTWDGILLYIFVIRSPAAARHSNPITGGDSQLRFVSEAGLGEAAEAVWAVACLNSALLARATAERGAVLA